MISRYDNCGDLQMTLEGTSQSLDVEIVGVNCVESDRQAEMVFATRAECHTTDVHRVISELASLPRNPALNSQIAQFCRVFRHNADADWQQTIVCWSCWWHRALNLLHLLPERDVRVFAIANPSVVCNVRAPYSRGWNFRQYFFASLHPNHPFTSVQNFTEIFPGEPLRRRR